MQGVATTGVLEVRSEPSRARVTIDGQARGSTPLTLRDVAPGDYQVVLERGGRTATQMVRVEPGATAQLDGADSVALRGVRFGAALACATIAPLPEVRR